MEKILKYRSGIYGLMALWIVIFHIHGDADIPFPFLERYLGFIVSLGNTGVDVFLFLSAYCLSLSFEKDSRVMSFYKRRVKRLLIPFVVISTPFYIWRASVAQGLSIPDRVINFLGDISGYNFVVHGMDWTWFVYGIFFLYLLFPLLFKLCKRGLVWGFLALLCSYVAIWALWNFIPSNIMSHRFAIAYCRLPIFIIGIIAALYLKRISTEKRRVMLCFSISAVLFLILFMFNLFLPDIYNPMFDGKQWLTFVPRVFPICFISAWLLEKMRSHVILDKMGGGKLGILSLAHINTRCTQSLWYQ